MSAIFGGTDGYHRHHCYLHFIVRLSVDMSARNQIVADKS